MNNNQLNSLVLYSGSRALQSQTNSQLTNNTQLDNDMPQYPRNNSMEVEEMKKCILGAVEVLGGYTRSSFATMKEHILQVEDTTERIERGLFSTIDRLEECDRVVASHHDSLVYLTQTVDALVNQQQYATGNHQAVNESLQRLDSLSSDLVSFHTFVIQTNDQFCNSVKNLDVSTDVKISKISNSYENAVKELEELRKWKEEVKPALAMLLKHDEERQNSQTKLEKMFNEAEGNKVKWELFESNELKTMNHRFQKDADDKSQIFLRLLTLEEKVKKFPTDIYTNQNAAAKHILDSQLVNDLKEDANKVNIWRQEMNEKIAELKDEISSKESQESNIKQFIASSMIELKKEHGTVKKKLEKDLQDFRNEITQKLGSEERSRLSCELVQSEINSTVARLDEGLKEIRGKVNTGTSQQTDTNYKGLEKLIKAVESKLNTNTIAFSENIKTNDRDIEELQTKYRNIQHLIDKANEEAGSVFGSSDYPHLLKRIEALEVDKILTNPGHSKNEIEEIVNTSIKNCLDRNSGDKNGAQPLEERKEHSNTQRKPLYFDVSTNEIIPTHIGAKIERNEAIFRARKTREHANMWERDYNGPHFPRYQDKDCFRYSRDQPSRRECWYGSDCRNRECTFYHPGPPSKKSFPGSTGHKAAIKSEWEKPLPRKTPRTREQNTQTKPIPSQANKLPGSKSAAITRNKEQEKIAAIIKAMGESLGEALGQLLDH